MPQSGGIAIAMHEHDGRIGIELRHRRGGVARLRRAGQQRGKAERGGAGQEVATIEIGLDFDGHDGSWF